MRIAVLGAGRIGSTVGRLWHSAGHEVTFAARDVADAQALAGELGARAQAATVAVAVTAADVVLVAVPGPAVADVLTAAGSLDETVIIDAANMMGPGRLSLRQLADRFPGGRWVRAFNTLQARVLAEENHRQPRWVLFLSGDETAKPAAAQLITDACGQVSRVVIAPATMTVTHLVVEPKDRQQLGRLVPLDLVDTTQGRISLRCTTAEFYQLSHAEKTQFVPGTGAYARHGPGQPAKPNWAQVQSRPDGVPGRLPQTFTYDVLPAGQVAVRGGDPVYAIDGGIGHITGVVMDAGSRRVAYMMLHAGHLLGRKNIAIPINAVTRVDAGIQLDITRKDVKHLPPVNLQQPDGY